MIFSGHTFDLINILIKILFRHNIFSVIYRISVLGNIQINARNKVSLLCLHNKIKTIFFTVHRLPSFFIFIQGVIW